MMKKRAALEQRDRLLAGVDEVVVFVAFSGRWPHAQNTVLAVQQHLQAGADVVGHQRRHADAEIDDVALMNVLRHACGKLVFAAFLVGHLQSINFLTLCFL